MFEVGEVGGKMLKKLCLLLFAIHYLLIANSFAGTGSTGWWIFRRPQSTKPRALTSVAAVRGDLSGVFYNPAVLGSVQQKEIFVMSELGMALDTFGGLLYGTPVGKNSGVAIGAVYYDAGRTTLYYMEGGELKERNVVLQRDIFGIVSYGSKLNSSVLAGATLKLANSNIAEVKDATAFAADVGALYFSNIEGLTFSLVGQNIGASTKFLNRAEELPFSVALGAAYGHHIRGNSYLGFGLEMPYILKEGRVLPTIGIEYGFERFSINLGYRFGASDSVFHVGFGFATKSLDFGYAYIPAVYLSPTHRFNVGFKFGPARLSVLDEKGRTKRANKIARN